MSLVERSFFEHMSIDPENIPENNGYVFNAVQFPEEILVLILSFVDKKELMRKCRYICKEWNELIKTRVWKMKAERENRLLFSKLHLQTRLPWSIYHSIVWKNPFDRNLLKNGSGQKGLKHWKIIENGGNRWKVESPPTGVPENEHSNIHSTCFATSYYNCTKQQCIDLVKEGLSPEMLDKYQPDISISEWIAGRWDCGSIYELNVLLLDEKENFNEENKNLTSFLCQERMVEIRDGWKKVSHTFKSYGPGIRYIMFRHSGKDTQFWAGHYGSKMSDARVEIHSSVLKRMQIEESGDIQ